MKRTVQTLLFVCFKTQQLPDTPNHRWMTALPCPIWRPWAGISFSCSLRATSHAYHLLIFFSIFTLRCGDRTLPINLRHAEARTSTAIPSFSICKLSSSASVLKPEKVGTKASSSHRHMQGSEPPQKDATSPHPRFNLPL